MCEEEEKTRSVILLIVLTLGGTWQEKKLGVTSLQLVICEIW